MKPTHDVILVFRLAVLTFACAVGNHLFVTVFQRWVDECWVYNLGRHAWSTARGGYSFRYIIAGFFTHSVSKKKKVWLLLYAHSRGADNYSPTRQMRVEFRIVE
jgi:hypothetical protein